MPSDFLCLFQSIRTPIPANSEYTHYGLNLKTQLFTVVF